MLPIEKAKGQVWLGAQSLCDVKYDISEPLRSTDELWIQRIILVVPDEHCAPLLNAYDLTLVLADGRRFAIPRPLQRVGLGYLECYVESLS